MAESRFYQDACFRKFVTGIPDFFTRSKSSESCSALHLRAIKNCGDPGGSRTPNPLLRRQMLYPVELRGRSVELSSLARSDAAGGCPTHLCFPERDKREKLGWETGIEPATVGATVRCSAS